MMPESHYLEATQVQTLLIGVDHLTSGEHLLSEDMSEETRPITRQVT